MSGSLKTILGRQYKAALARWPKDQLRPDVQLQDVLNKNMAGRLAGQQLGQQVIGGSGNGDSNLRLWKARPPPSDLDQLRQINALFSLLDDRYKKKNRITGAFLTPRSNPTYYDDLMTELEEAPKRSFLGRIKKRLGGMFRLS